jgi:hypothetical protein
MCTAGSAVSALMLAVYALVEVAPQKAGEQLNSTWAPLLLFILLSFCNGIVGQMPWMLLSEVFPFRYVANDPYVSNMRLFLYSTPQTYQSNIKKFSSYLTKNLTGIAQ